ncbi:MULTISPECIES: asparagine synthase (glutamine-hydrolyzing) [unclassified Crossiella]|uniref:asparagine synthase (glutamine-hydrolyzing) n=1 Tax=unclassified Crossiella TaxID=2620835 RepID=UPI002000168C|nr:MULTISPECIES: asparagine synthase (glutamine-hydrolyzing) [unclassified Crossiella]MCK2242527.1 asparagine synthase (glutamine-hydrolyzing) [Crossiella sp. S99.2]MCK2254443.1 asparagine synthase (glutamine-hydrolyzing) [Crossiella sp. S99.1]
MCGIAGWVGYQRDLTQEQDTAAAMTETMACRGPDDSGLWLDRHAAIGQRRLAIIDLEGGRQPMVAEQDGRTAAVLSYSGEVYNFRELRAELQRRGHHFRTASDTEVVLTAYLEWGPALVDRLNGMYAFAIWDARSEELLLVRDRMGIKPLYYYPTADGVLFGSEPKAILANPLAEAVLDADGLREALAFVKTPELGILRGLFEVRPGSVVTVSRKGIGKSRYWQLEATEHTDDLDTTVGTVRELLEDIVERQLIADVPLCTLLSGGLDSSALTALAAKALTAQGAGPVRSFSIDFAGYTDNFHADAFRDSPDAPFVAEVAAHVAADHTNIVLDNDDLMDPAVRAAALHARDLPTGMGEMDFSLYLLFQAIRGRSTVALSGESADEVFGGYKWFHDPAAVNGGTFPWIAARAHSQTESVYSGLAQRLQLRDYVQQRYQEALTEVPRLAGETGLEARMRELSYLNLTRFVNILLDRKDRMSMAVGLEVRVPFCDHRLVQYVFNAPWAMKTFDGKEKSLLRAATADVLPQSVVQRKKSPYPSTQDAGYEKALREELATVLTDSAAPVCELVPRKDIQQLLDSPLNAVGSDSATRRTVESLLGLNRWILDYDVRLAV